MSEIEKLYENVKVYDFRYDCDVSFTDGQFGRITSCSKGEVKDYCTDKKYFKSAKVINYKRLYPPFTAKKQLELIKWLGKRHCCGCDEKLAITIGEDNYSFISVGLRTFEEEPEIFTDYCFGAKQFDEALAGLINNLWQDLTEEEKEQIREILK